MTEEFQEIDIKLHYYLKDSDSHAMNAKIHNECEKQFIQSINLLNKYLDEPFEVIVFAKEEGGVKDYYKVIIKNPLALIIITALITNSTQQFFTSNFSPAINATEETKNKLNNLEKIKELIKKGNLTEEEFDYIVSNDKELKKVKSNYFKSAKKEKAITSIRIEAFTPNSENCIINQSIEYPDFDNCIIPEEQEEKYDDVDAKIYIVSPVLIRGRRDLWKGICNHESIEFRVTDKVFLENVYQHIIKFSNGTYINCIMRVKTTKSSIDDNVKISRTITDISSWGDDEINRTIIKKPKRTNLNNDNTELKLDLFAEN